MAQWPHMATQIWVNISSGTKPLPKLIWTWNNWHPFQYKLRENISNIIAKNNNQIYLLKDFLQIFLETNELNIFQGLFNIVILDDAFVRSLQMKDVTNEIMFVIGYDLDKHHRIHNIDGLVQESRNFSVSAMESRLYCTNPSMYCWPVHDSRLVIVMGFFASDSSHISILVFFLLL